MDLFLFPEAASLKNGYGIGVEFAYNKLKPKEEDIVVWYTSEKNIPYLKNNDVVISRKISKWKRIKNVLKCRPSTELNACDLSFLRGKKFDNIHCDEILFFHALREIFPHQHINVRLHNVFARILERKKLMNISIDPKFHLILHLCRKSEVEIMRDKNSTKIFVAQEDCDYYRSMFGKTSDSEVWKYNPQKANNVFWPIKDKKLVWFGGLDVHKKSSVEWFVKDVFLPLYEKDPEFEFHVFGRGSSCFNNPDCNIFGYGFYDGKSKWPMSNCLYINPDTIGGGIKLKLMSLIEDGVPFITTPFGFEGYNKDLIDNKICHVVELDRWKEYIESIFNC